MQDMQIVAACDAEALDRRATVSPGPCYACHQPNDVTFGAEDLDRRSVSASNTCTAPCVPCRQPSGAIEELDRRGAAVAYTCNTPCRQPSEAMFDAEELDQRGAAVAYTCNTPCRQPGEAMFDAEELDRRAAANGHCHACR